METGELRSKLTENARLVEVLAFPALRVDRRLLGESGQRHLGGSRARDVPFWEVLGDLAFGLDPVKRHSRDRLQLTYRRHPADQLLLCMFCTRLTDSLSNPESCAIRLHDPKLRARSSARILTATAESAAPVRRSSATVSASNPAPRKISAHSLGRFSSVFSFKPYAPKEGPPCPRAQAQQHRPERPECPVPE